jgi:pimeloyl-ACP methyl ester carboxylesterase
MANFVLIHGAGDVGWYWHLTEAELRARGHHAIAPDLPCDNDAVSLDDYARAVTDAIAGRLDPVIVSQSYGAFTAALVAARIPARLLVLLAGMIPAPGESPGQWWDNTGYEQAVKEQAERDGGKTGGDDPLSTYYNRRAGRAGRGSPAQRRSRGAIGGLEHALAPRCVAGRTHQVHPLPGRPVLPRRLYAAGGTRTPGHDRGRGPRVSLRRAQPPEGTQPPTRQLPQLTPGKGSDARPRAGRNRSSKDKDTCDARLLIDFITSLDGYAAADGWPGFWGLEGPEYLAWLGGEYVPTILAGPPDTSSVSN